MRIFSVATGRLILYVLICLSFPFCAQSHSEEQVQDSYSVVISDTTDIIKPTINYESPVDLNRTDLFKLTSLQIFDTNYKSNVAELQDFQHKTNEAFNSLAMVIDWYINTICTEWHDDEPKPLRQPFKLINNQIVTNNCSNRQQNIYKLKPTDNKELLLILESDDHGHHLDNQLTFKK